MDGTTRCPHCETRFKIVEAQLTAHGGMVRCGHCLQAFDARPDFIAEQADLQLELPIDAVFIPDEVVTEQDHHEVSDVQEWAEAPDETAATLNENTGHAEEASPILQDASPDAPLIESEPEEKQDLIQTVVTQPVLENTVFAEAIHAEEVYREEHTALTEHTEMFRETVPEKRRTWPWLAGIFFAALLQVVQSVYFFRISLAAQLPAVKPALTELCHLLGCSVPLPKKMELINIESSSLDADPAHANQITLNALLRNRASYTMAFPALALTLNDSQDKPLARRVLLPGDYLPADETEKTGFLSNHEVNVKLPLNTGDLQPVGYRLELFYSKK